ncbi:superoxide dismutase family protein [Gordonia shandongensis]|uniref:superoxide dismutase family protein n=1 Tax=Gordonia shandongensis TaxID=376351 RepID=UPI0004149692|nr:superoxide dismutase family protein [Gordonia shandongensis]
MTVRSTNRTSTVRVVAALAVAGGATLALAACTPHEESSDAPYTTPSVVTGDQVAPGDVVNADGIPGGVETASATLVSKDGTRVGFVTFSQEDPSTVKVSVRADNATPGKHGLHIHTGTVCEPASSFESAGGHYQAPGHTGKPESGDLIDLDVLKNGTATASYTTEAFKLTDVAGRALILHESDEADAPRYACGIITAAK